jgi:hypothetical protein
MPVTPINPSDVFDRISEIERRLRDLASGSGLRNASMSDLDGVERVKIGRLEEGVYGILVKDDNGHPVFRVDGSGLTYPGLSLASKKSTDSVVVNSGSFVPAWETVESWVTHNSIRWRSSVVVDAATTGEARLYAPGIAGTPATSILGLPAGVQTEIGWNWAIPGLAIGSEQMMVQLQVRRTAGAGNISVYAPYNLWAANDTTIGATASGL